MALGSLRHPTVADRLPEPTDNAKSESPWESLLSSIVVDAWSHLRFGLVQIYIWDRQTEVCQIYIYKIFFLIKYPRKIILTGYHWDNFFGFNYVYKNIYQWNLILIIIIYFQKFPPKLAIDSFLKDQYSKERERMSELAKISIDTFDVVLSSIFDSCSNSSIMSAKDFLLQTCETQEQWSFFMTCMICYSLSDKTSSTAKVNLIYLLNDVFYSL